MKASTKASTKASGKTSGKSKKKTLSAKKKRRRNAKPANTLPESLEVRSNTTFKFGERGWSKQKHLVEHFVDAIAQTALFEHLPLVSLGVTTAAPHGGLSAIKTAFTSGKSSCALLAGGKTIYQPETTAFIELEITPGAAHVTTLVQGPILAQIGARALDDFFTMLRFLHDKLDGAAHVKIAHAWTNWDDNTPKSKLDSDWPLRSIGDVLEPARPKRDEDDVFWDAARALAKAKAPAAAKRTTHGGLIMLRWVDDPTDARAADAAALAHEKWVKGIVKTTPLSG